MNNKALDECVHFLRLHSISHFGYSSLVKFSKFFNCKLQQLHQISRQELTKAGWKQEQIDCLKGHSANTESLISKAIQWQAACEKRRIVHIGLDEYPSMLLETSSIPLVIFCEGSLDLLKIPKLAVVGTRAPTQYAYDALEQILKPFANTDIATISGLAIGVDSICHRISLAYEIPTIAVLGNATDIVYPKRNMKLYEQIKKSGLLISEFWPGTHPKPFHFPRRNRLISGLASAILISEGRIKSGTMVSVRYAIEQNKDVLVIPCNVTNINGELSHQLITEGAVPIRCSEEIFEQVLDFQAYKAVKQKNEKISGQDLASDPLLDSVGDSATSVDLIAKRTGIPVLDVLTQLLEYELRGLVASTAEGYIKLRG